MIASIDRIEEGFAVLITDEDEERIVINADVLYPGAKESDIVDISGEPGNYTIAYLPEETKKRKEEIEALFNRLRKK